jgi:uncharacterized protein
MHKIIITSLLVLTLLNSTGVQAMQREAKKTCPATDASWSPLHLAAKKGKTEEVARLLVTNPALVHARTTNGETPLLIAARHGWPAVVGRLMTSSDINAADHHGNTPLSSAMKKKHIAIVRMLLEANANPDQGSPLFWAVYHDLVPEAQLLINARADVNAPNRKGITCLREAAFVGNPSMIQLLLSAGAQIDTADSENATPLLGAIALNHTSAAELLIAAGANIHAIDRHGRTPLHLATLENNTVLVSSLLARGAASDLNIISAQGYTPLLSAAHGGLEDLALRLITAGADVNCTDLDGELTPLHHAAQGGHVRLVQMLLAAGASIQRTPVNPLLFAADGGHHLLAELLISAGAEVNTLDPRMNVTPLHQAVKQNHAQVVRVLLAHGALASIVDGEGKTPIQIAEANDNKEITDMFQEALLKEKIERVSLETMREKRTEDDAELDTSAAKRPARDTE